MTCSRCGAPFTPPRSRGGGRPRTKCDACRSPHAKIDGKRWRDLRAKLLAGQPPCVVCGVRVATEVDHIVPLARGGEPYELWNLQVSCKRCNASKAARVRNFGELEPKNGSAPPAPRERSDWPQGWESMVAREEIAGNTKIVYFADGSFIRTTALRWDR